MEKVFIRVPSHLFYGHFGCSQNSMLAAKGVRIASWQSLLQIFDIKTKVDCENVTVVL